MPILFDEVKAITVRTKQNITREPKRNNVAGGRSVSYTQIITTESAVDRSEKRATKCNGMNSYAIRFQCNVAQLGAMRYL